MGEKVVLPNFDLPRDSTRVAMRVLWVMGGVVVLATLVLGLAMWHHRSLEIATAAGSRRQGRGGSPRGDGAPPAPAPKVVEKTSPDGRKRDHARERCWDLGCGPPAAARPRLPRQRTPSGPQLGRTPAQRQGRPRHGKRGAALLERIDGKGAKAASKPAKAVGRPCEVRRRLPRQPAEEVTPVQARRVGERSPLSYAEDAGFARKRTALPRTDPRAAFGGALNCFLRRAT